MTVNTTVGIVTYIADGATTIWTFSFPGVDPKFIQVTTTDTSGNVTILPSNVFSITLNPPVDPNPTSVGGQVVYPLTGSPLASGNLLTIQRILPAVQSVSLANQGTTYPQVVEQEFDYLTLLSQGRAEEITRAFQVGAEDPVPALVPPVAQRAGRSAFFDSQGNLTGGSVPSGGAFISAAMTPVVEASTTQSAQDLMGVTAAIAAAIASLLTTGDLKPTHKTVADAGWIMWIDGTIGNAGSSSSVRANADTQALFTLYYNSYSDTNCPLLTSAGAATTRAVQGTASAAFAAGCRMTLPKAAGRSLSVSGQGLGLTNRVLGSSAGAEVESPTVAKTAPHSHQLTGTTSGQPVQPLAQYDPLQNMTFGGTNGVEGSFNANTGGGQALNILSPSTYINVMVKL